MPDKHLTFLLLACAACGSSKAPSEAQSPATEQDAGLDAGAPEHDSSTEPAEPDAAARDAAVQAPEADAGADASAVIDAGPRLGLDARPTGQTCLATDAPAARLTDTGCFSGTPAREGSTLVPFDVIAPLWSDGAEKSRYFALPDGTTITVAEDGDFLFPVGTVLVKTFGFAGTKIETRLLMHVAEGAWLGFAYQWNDTQTDAILLDAGKAVTVGSHEWSIPSRDQCFECHTESASFSLGLRVEELDSAMLYEATGRVANQLDTLSAIGMLTPPVHSSESVGLTDYRDEAAPVEARARAYLDANCAGCHRPGGPGELFADFRATASLGEMGICDTLPKAGDLGIVDARVLAPGAPERSTIVERMRRVDATRDPAARAGRMPPVGVSVPDRLGIDVVSTWIAQLAACPEQ